MSKKKDVMYGSLKAMLDLAYDRAAYGKGRDRHANNLPFEDQPMQVINRLTDCGFSYGQIYKKILEIPNLTDDMDKVNEMLDIIVYACGYCLVKNEQRLNSEVGGYETADMKFDELYKQATSRPKKDDFSGLPETITGR